MPEASSAPVWWKICCASVSRLAATAVSVAVAYGWPLAGVPTVPAAGARLAPGEDNIIYGLNGTKPDRYYAIAGLKITYSYQDRNMRLSPGQGSPFALLQPQAQSLSLAQANRPRNAGR